MFLNVSHSCPAVLHDSHLVFVENQHNCPNDVFRCIESKKKTHDELAAKYLKPLGIPRK